MPAVVVACGALASELRAVLHDQVDRDGDGRRDGWPEVRYLPAHLHNRPDRIVDAIDAALADVDADRDVVLAYADCGTGGLLDAYIERRNSERSAAGSPARITRLQGAHCYEVFAGSERFAALQRVEPGTFYLTDFLAKHFDALVWQGLGLADHPELLPLYFGNYHRLVLLSQSDDARVVDAAVAAARRLQLEFEHIHVGRCGLGTALTGGLQHLDPPRRRLVGSNS